MNPNHKTENEQSTSKEKMLVSPPSISLPKGGGAIRGMGEKFAANPVTGTGSMTVPIATSPGRSGFGPQLNLSYDSGSGYRPRIEGLFAELSQLLRVAWGYSPYLKRAYFLLRTRNKRSFVSILAFRGSLYFQNLSPGRQTLLCIALYTNCH